MLVFQKKPSLLIGFENIDNIILLFLYCIYLLQNIFLFSEKINFKVITLLYSYKLSQNSIIIFDTKKILIYKNVFTLHLKEMF